MMSSTPKTRSSSASVVQTVHHASSIFLQIRPTQPLAAREETIDDAAECPGTWAILSCTLLRATVPGSPRLRPAALPFTRSRSRRLRFRGCSL